MNALTNNTATLFRRYLWLLDVIYSAGRITLDENPRPLAAERDVGRRGTAPKDL